MNFLVQWIHCHVYNNLIVPTPGKKKLHRHKWKQSHCGWCINFARNSNHLATVGWQEKQGREQSSEVGPAGSRLPKQTKAIYSSGSFWSPADIGVPSTIDELIQAHFVQELIDWMERNCRWTEADFGLKMSDRVGRDWSRLRTENEWLSGKRLKLTSYMKSPTESEQVAGLSLIRT